MRLVGTFGPLRENDRPRDAFERAALERALTGQPSTTVQRDDDQWYYRRSIPLSNFRMECALCHTNFPPGPTPDWVGALMPGGPTGWRARPRRGTPAPIRPRRRSWLGPPRSAMREILLAHSRRRPIPPDHPGIACFQGEVMSLDASVTPALSKDKDDNDLLV